ncbi:MAG: twin-arginine translocation signal domain-containing protein [Pseudomonadota bacterium]
MFRRQFLKRSGAMTLSASLVAPQIARADYHSDGDSDRPPIRPTGPVRLRVGFSLSPLDVRLLGELDYDANLTRFSRIGQSVRTLPSNRSNLLGNLGTPPLDDEFRSSTVAGLIMTFPGNEGAVFCHAMSIGGAIGGDFTFHNSDREFRPRINLQPAQQRIKFNPETGRVIGVAIKNDQGNTVALIPPALLADELVENTSGPGADELKRQYRRLKARR